MLCNNRQQHIWWSGDKDFYFLFLNFLFYVFFLTGSIESLFS